MKFTKIFQDTLDHGYAVMRLQAQGRDFVVIASEENQPCYAYDLDNDYRRITVWPDVGGTMTMVQLPGTLDFLATQRFYPGFNSAACRIVKAVFTGDQWDVREIQEFPYIHRFDIIPQDNGYLFIGCSIANSKKNTDDWSDPGKIFVGEYDAAQDKLTNIRALPQRLTKNHGYRRVPGAGYSFITAEDGIFKLFYPTAAADWRLTQVSDRATSDIAFADVNGDGQPEYLTIEGFHGPDLNLYDHDFTTLWHSTRQTPFGHAIEGTKLLGQSAFLFGYRAAEQDLELLTWRDAALQTQLIEAGVGPSNVLVYERDGQQYLLSANREANRIAIYQVSQDA